MSVVTRSNLTDEALHEAIATAHLPSLLPALGLLTGDWDSHRELRPARYKVVEEQGGMTPEQQQRARELAFDVLRRFRDGELGPPRTDTESVLKGLEPLLGDDFDAYRDLSLEELAIDDADPRAPSFTLPERMPNGNRVLDAVVVGAGMSGLLAAHRLAQAGAQFVVFDKNPDLGGTWFENSYPGCRVDVPSYLYSYSCLRDADWSHAFATRDEVQAAFRRFATENDLLGHLRFGHEVVSADWAEDRRTWRVSVRGRDGSREDVETRVLVSAVGQLNRPSVPELPGQHDFRGPQFHSAAWDHEAPLTGRRYAVIGTGASAIQVVTGLIKEGATVDVFQRSPAWLFPTPELRRPFSAGERWLLHNVPTYARWYRLWLHRSVSDGLLPFAVCDPEWDDPRSVSAINDTVRQSLTAYIEAQFADLPDLLGGVLPTYPAFSKRVIRDDGSWAEAFRSGSARLVTSGIDRLVADGIVTDDGEHHALDGIVYATGFHASDFLVPMKVRGRRGRDLHEHWAGDASAYLGITVPGFPNLFLMYGPNTNIVVNGSAIFFSECQAKYLLEYVREVVSLGVALDVRPERHDAFRAQVDDMNRQRAWGCTGVRNWYTNATGRVSQNWPGTALDYWQRTRRLDPEDYDVIDGGSRNA